MKTLTPALKALLEAPVTHLTYCWRLDRLDGVRLGFTVHDRPLTIEGLIYRPLAGDVPSAAQSDAQLSVDSITLNGALNLSGLSEADLLAGRYDRARLSVFLADWQQPQIGTVFVFAGVLGDVTLSDQGYEAEVRGYSDLLDAPVGEVHSLDCRAQLGDTRCKVALRLFTDRSRIVSVQSAQEMQVDIARPDGWFDQGLMRVWTGPAAGTTVEIARQTGTHMDLFQALPVSPSPGDIVELVAGCDKRLSTCRSKFTNALNFRGEPFIPGQDALLAYPDSR